MDEKADTREMEGLLCESVEWGHLRDDHGGAIPSALQDLHREQKWWQHLIEWKKEKKKKYKATEPDRDPSGGMKGPGMCKNWFFVVYLLRWTGTDTTRIVEVCAGANLQEERIWWRVWELPWNEFAITCNEDLRKNNGCEAETGGGSVQRSVWVHAWKGATNVEARCRKSVERSQKNRYI